MPKIKKDTIKKLPQTHSLKIFKYEGSDNYYCSFYVGQVYTRNGNKKAQTFRQGFFLSVVSS